MKKVLSILILVSLFFVPYFMFFHGKVDKKTETETSTKKQGAQTTKTGPQTKNTQQEERPGSVPSTLGRAFVFVVLIGSVGAILYFAWKDKRGTGAAIPWSDILWQPVFIALAAVIVLNSLANLFAYPYWLWFWDHQTFFWGVNMAIVPLVHFVANKNIYAKYVAISIVILIVTGFYAELSKEEGWKSFRLTNLFGLSDNSAVSRTRALTPAPASVALPIIADCESRGQQFEKDGKTPLKNKERASTAFGKYQFLESHREPAKQAGFDLDTEAGQDGYARYRYDRYGTTDWEADQRSRNCWEPKLAALGYSNNGNQEGVKLPMQLATFEIPTDKWSQKVMSPLIPGTNLVWGREDKTKGGNCEYMLDGNPNKVFPITESTFNMSPEFVQFKCTEPVRLNVYVVRKN